ncbi:TlpA family protein disulfide reductase [Solitalea koreensis]|uniref:AhpC/TSA family protein n=1 Tax=Solitalea koreensis TaxID=543615 RepID=A0A521BC86_9SPHI|nr:TlpA family protein disulfide reductase [Solitalea koreensis]SMO44687.1 AhpC/TSA family protein [Solitalea koreensis]
MRKLLLFVCLIPLLSCAQPNKKTEMTYKNANGKSISYDEMSYLLLTGDYKMQQLKNAEGDYNEIRLLKTTPSEKETALFALATPNLFFEKGKEVPNEEFTTLDGKTLRFEQLKGKVVVVNFWFTTCAPCLKEIPELNELVEKYKANDQVVFLAFSTDKKDVLERFLNTKKFNYQQIPDVGKMLDNYEISYFPSNLIITSEGKSYFFTSGYIPTIKSILDYMIETNLKSSVGKPQSIH